MINRDRLRLVLRREWGARPPQGLDYPMDGVIKNAFFVYTNTDPCRTREECVKAVQEIQGYHMEHGQTDIPYSFILGGDGITYEGRGFKVSPHVPDYMDVNRGQTLVFARIGSYEDGFQMDFQGGHKMVKYCYDMKLNNKTIQGNWPVKDWNTYRDELSGS